MVIMSLMRFCLGLVRIGRKFAITYFATASIKVIWSCVRLGKRLVNILPGLKRVNLLTSTLAWRCIFVVISFVLVDLITTMGELKRVIYRARSQRGREALDVTGDEEMRRAGEDEVEGEDEGDGHCTLALPRFSKSKSSRFALSFPTSSPLRLAFLLRFALPLPVRPSALRVRDPRE